MKNLKHDHILAVVIVFFLALLVQPPRTANISEAQGGGDAGRGAQFAQICKTLVCHPSGDFYDLAYFDYSDQSIYRRARPHVPSAQIAWDLVAYIKQLRSTHNINTISKETRLYQPGGVVLADDQAFGIELFGQDHWPANLTPAELKAIDPKHVKIALPLPAWSNEDTNYEWLPTHLLPKGVLSLMQPTYSTYFANRTDSNLSPIVYNGSILHDLRKLGTADAVCAYPPDPRWNPELCFDAFKWAAAASVDVAMRKNNLMHAVTTTGFDNQWWEVGHIAHKSQQYHNPIRDHHLHIAGWIHLGWMFDLSLNKNSLYETTPLANLGLRRHATFVALRTLVQRNPNATGVELGAMCVDVLKSVDDGYVPWMYESTKFAYNYLLNLLNTGAWNPSTGCRTPFTRAQTVIGQKLPSSQAAALKIIHDQVLAKLP